MPFLFERVQDETELLLPDNLLHSNSLIRKLVQEIDEEDWQEVEIIGWIYQFYISERKKEVIGKVVKSEDIPAATQLFTPNWIVKYLVQNSIGSQWMATYPNSPLKEQMEYYIEPAEQTDEVNAKLAEITPASLNPEEMTLLDPACGSGHILVEGYDLFKAIYQERGYRAKDIPRLVLEKNLHGLEIDDRAAQLASFAVLMKARSDDRRILEDGVKLSIFSIQSSDGLDADALFEALSGEEPEPLPPGEEFDFVEEAKTPLLTYARRLRVTTTADVGFTVDDIRVLLSLFKGDDAKTFGSLIRIPEGLANKLPEIGRCIDRISRAVDLNRQPLGGRVQAIAQQAAMLSTLYDAVVTNPPYMGSKLQNAPLSAFAKSNFPVAAQDLFAMFAFRMTDCVGESGFVAFITPFVWMFIPSYAKYRSVLLQSAFIQSLIQLEYNAFEPACVPVCAYTLRKTTISSVTGTFIDLSGFPGHANQAPRTLDAIHGDTCKWRYEVASADLAAMPGSPIAYTLPAHLRRTLAEATPLSTIADLKQGIKTGENERFLRLWHEVSLSRIGFDCQTRREADDSDFRWFPCNKGGPFRKWYGNNEFLLDWHRDGHEIRNFFGDNGRL